VLIPGDFDYYIEARDARGGPPGRAGSPDAPFHVTVAPAVVASAPVPPPAMPPPVDIQPGTRTDSAPESTPTVAEPVHVPEGPPVIIRRVEPAVLEPVPTMKKKGDEPSGYKFLAFLGYAGSAACAILSATSFAESERTYAMYRHQYVKDGFIDGAALSKADEAGARAMWLLSGSAAGIVLGTAFVLLSGGQ
jgi:hypothetical protein